MLYQIKNNVHPLFVVVIKMNDKSCISQKNVCFAFFSYFYLHFQISNYNRSKI